MKETIETQVCANCKLEKPLSEYYFIKATQKYNRQCKNCLCVKAKAYREANSEKCLAYRRANAERYRANRKAYYRAYPEKCRNARRNWERANREKCRAKCAKRRADRIKATPAWADLKKIAQIYKDCPPGYHIDHIFPLVSDKMCGLHVENNLQYLTPKENAIKKNKVTLDEQLNG